MRVAVIGCGNRGADVYARLLTAQGVTISHLVELRAARRAEVAARHPGAQVFEDWDEFFRLGKVAEAVVIATPDDQHVTPCLRALALGYEVLLEKPVCLHEHELDALLGAEGRSSGSVTVCQVLRFAPMFRAAAALVRGGRLGQIIAAELQENVAWWHYAHSYVRGNWRSAPSAAPFILAKSCHDLDLLRWLAGSPPERVQSQGGLRHFRPEQRPEGAAARCVDCTVPCAYDARRIYGTRPADVWPVTVLTAGGLSLDEALRDGPYGECVYLGLNNVADHQSVTVTFENGVTGALSSSAFTAENTRHLRVLGSAGELRGELSGGRIEVHDFLSGQTELIQVDASGNHGGGDAGLVDAWLRRLNGESADSEALPSFAESLDSHRMAFAAERSRLER
jgi:predicted dehydrogenase